MALKQTADHLRSLLHQVTSDLEKAEYNKAASQRVRTGTIKLEKVAKVFRKESIKHDKSTKGRKKVATKAAAKAKAAPKKPTATAKKTTAKKTPAKKTPVKKAAVKKTPARKTAVKGKALSLKRKTQTAKLPTRRAAH